MDSIADRPFLLSYGGGHARIMVELAHELERREKPFKLLGLTTAEQEFRRAGLMPMPLDRLIDPGLPRSIRDRALELAPAPGHADVSQAQTDAYYTIGFADLVERLGLAGAEDAVARDGRKAFEPVAAFERLFAREWPSIVVATTSPRFEVAALRAARRMGIASVAIGDMFLVAEQEWILTPDYAADLTVVSEGVAEMLRATGKCSSRIHVLGNPAFDRLVPSPDDPAIRARERKRLGVGEKLCILWPLGGTPDEVAGRSFLAPAQVAELLDGLCEKDPGLTYVLRPHPNWPVSALTTKYGMLDNSGELEANLLAADLVCVEASTVGLQAILRGIPTICLHFADYVLYPDFGWALSARTVDEMVGQIQRREFFDPPAEIGRQAGGAAARVAELVIRLEHGISRENPESAQDPAPAGVPR